MVFLLSTISEALARSGGGGGFSTGGDGGGSSGGGDGGDASELVELILWLVWEMPAVGIPVLLLAIGVAVVLAVRARRSGGSAAVRPAPRTAPRPAEPPRLAELLARDPGFSEVLFLDFARLVYVRAHEERGRNNLAPLEAVLAPAAAQKLAARGTAPVRDVILGSVQLRALRVVGDTARAEVRFVANYTEGDTVKFADERWTFERAADHRSPGPDGMQALRCPTCGSALETRTDGGCVSCGAPLTNGSLLWRATAVAVDALREVPNLTLELGGGTESGTNLELVRPPDFAASQRQLAERHPEFDQVAFNRRAIEIFTEVQAAWAAMDLERVRGLETDGVFQSHRYWIERYRREGLRNHMERLSVTGCLPARIQMDAWHTAITVRLFASALDWTEDRTGKVVGGSKTEAKRFSEYWTFVRTAGKALTLHADVRSCPSCAAPLDRVGEGGVCGYCDAKITSGDFDWVLAAIDQDDVYGR